MYDRKRPPLLGKENRSPVLYKELMMACWKHEPHERPSMHQVQELIEVQEFEKLRKKTDLKEADLSIISCACVCRIQCRRSKEEHKCSSNYQDDVKFLNCSKDSGVFLSQPDGNQCNETQTRQQLIQRPIDKTFKTIHDPCTQIWICECTCEETNYKSKASVYVYTDGEKEQYNFEMVS